MSLYDSAVTLHKAGHLREAMRLYAEFLAECPDHAGALHMMGMVTIQSGDASHGIELINRSLRLNSRQPLALSSLGNAMRQLRRPAEALEHYDRALMLDPGHVPSLNNRGSALLDLHRPIEALDSFERALLLRPDHVGALCNHGNALLTLGRSGEALRQFERALECQPRYAAAGCFRARALRALQRLDDALRAIDAAIALDPSMATAHQERGNVLRELRRLPESVSSYERSAQIDPSSASTFFRLGIALVEIGDNAAAVRAFARTLGLAPHHPFALGGLVFSKRMLCDWSNWQEDTDGILGGVEAGRPVTIPFSLLGVSDSAAVQLSCTRTYVGSHLPPSPAPLWCGVPYRHNKIRLAYVSGDLRMHAVAALLAGVFEGHDRKRFEVIAVSLQPAEASPMGRRLTAAFDAFIDVSRMSDAEVAALIREREIDVAVDLMGFTSGSRTGIFSHRPAPVQVNFLGFPGTMGAPYMDYLLADDFVIPPGSRGHYAEQVVWLSGCFQPNDARRALGDRPTSRRSDLGLPEAGFVFCCFNNNYKVNPTYFGVWMRLLHAIPGAVLWLLADESGAAANLRRECSARGVDPSRLIFANRVPYPEHLARLASADLFLDTSPFNAGTTASDALWSGLPLLTCAGGSFAARMAGSLLRAVGLPELITYDLAGYEAMALKLALDPAFLMRLRRRLAKSRLTSALFDSDRFCRTLESAFERMWRCAERAERPREFSAGAPPSAVESDHPARDPS